MCIRIHYKTLTPCYILLCYKYSLYHNLFHNLLWQQIVNCRRSLSHGPNTNTISFFVITHNLPLQHVVDKMLLDLLYSKSMHNKDTISIHLLCLTFSQAFFWFFRLFHCHIGSKHERSIGCLGRSLGNWLGIEFLFKPVWNWLDIFSARLKNLLEFLFEPI